MIERLLTDAVTIRRRGAVTADVEGNPSATYTTVETVGRVEQDRTSDTASGDERRRGQWQAFLPPDATVAGGDQLVAHGITFEVEGDPWLARTPSGPHHWEVDLRTVSP